MASQSKTTQDHDEIRKWAEERGGKPSHVKSTGGSDDVGILRIDFPGYSGEGSLEEIPWDEFFEKFDQQNLALLYQEETAEGEKSNFNKLVSAATAEENEERATPSRGRKAVKKAAAKKTPAPAKKTVAKKAAVPAKKTAAKKAPAPVKKAAAKSTSKKAAPPAKKAAPKKAAPKKVATKKVASKKVAPKKAAPKKVAPKKAAAKKVAAKKAPAKKSAGRPAKKSGFNRR